MMKAAEIQQSEEKSATNVQENVVLVQWEQMSVEQKPAEPGFACWRVTQVSSSQARLLCTHLISATSTASNHR